MPHHKTEDDASVPQPSSWRRSVVVVLLCTLIGAALGWGYSLVRPAPYTSEVRILLNPVTGSAYAPSPRNDELISLETEAQIVRSDDVLSAAAAEAPGDPDVAELDRRLAVSVPTNTQVLVLTYDGTSPEKAQDTLDAIATAYLDDRVETTESVTAAQLDDLDEQLEDVITSLREATAASQQGSQTNQEFQAQLADALSSELVVLRAQRSELETASPRPGRVLSPASLPSSGTALRPFVPVIAGAIAGLLVGLVLATLLGRSGGREPSSTTVP